MNISRTTTGIYISDFTDNSLHASSLMSREDQLRRLDIAKTQSEWFSVFFPDGTCYQHPKTRRTRFSFDTAESIVENFLEKGVKCESVRV